MNGKCRQFRWRTLQKTVFGFIAILLLGGVLFTLPFALQQDDDNPLAIIMTGIKVRTGTSGMRLSLIRQPVRQCRAVLPEPVENICAALRTVGTFDIAEANNVMRM